MFTGLVEATGRVISLQTRGEQARLVLAIPFAAELTLGESVAVNGCCLTVAQIDDQEISFDLLAQTLQLTSLGTLQENSLVNLERALLPTTRLGGHFVQGHVDATVTVLDWSQHGQDHCLTVTLPPEQRGLVIPKGSICLDGISLTAAEVTAETVTCWIIPHTIAMTHLKAMSPGRRLNVEFDMLGKYVQNLIAARG
jgi:riboflavin synthase